MPSATSAARSPSRSIHAVLAAVVLVSLVGWAGCHIPGAGLKPLTRDLLTGRKVDFNGSYARGMTWLEDGRHYLHRRAGKLMRVDALTEEAEPAYDADALEAALAAHDDFDEEQAKRLAQRPRQWTEDRSSILIQHRKRLYLYWFGEGELTRLTEEAEVRRVVTLSPSGDFVSFVRGNNLFVIDTGIGEQQQLTEDGSDTILNGILDWVYQEEIYGRGRWRAHWWRDDAEYLAYLRLDEADVPLYSIADYMPHISTLDQTRYPKAGDPLPTVRLGVVHRETEEAVWVDLSKYEDTDILIVRVSWAPDGKLLFSVQDREQRWLELNEADPRTGQMSTLIRETSPAWTDNLGHPHWLDDGSFLWLSERGGYHHIYHYARDGKLIRPLTTGKWAVQTLLGHDADSGWVYFTGLRDGVLETHAYRAGLTGGEIERLTQPGSSHRVSFDPTFTLFFDTFSNVSTPTQVHLRKADGSLVRVVSENHVQALDEYAWSTPELLEVANRDGFPMQAQIIRPPNFDPSRKYPVLCPVYGGPGAPTVGNRWGGSRQLFYQYLAQQDYIIWRCDPYSSTRGVAAAAWHAYRQLGENELDDLEDSLIWLIDQGYIDPERIGITGGSYGGYFAAYALTHSDLFKIGIATSLLSDWRNYDAVYAERYMQTPENNPEGYERAAVSGAARDLHGRLLIVHGLLDDNVHFQNAVQLIDALQKHGKMFDLMVYPRDGHSLGRGGQHHRQHRLKYILDNL